jgi:hypothetical protein
MLDAELLVGNDPSVPLTVQQCDQNVMVTERGDRSRQSPSHWRGLAWI